MNSWKQTALHCDIFLNSKKCLVKKKNTPTRNTARRIVMEVERLMSALQTVVPEQISLVCPFSHSAWMQIDSFLEDTKKQRHSRRFFLPHHIRQRNVVFVLWLVESVLAGSWWQVSILFTTGPFWSKFLSFRPNKTVIWWTTAFRFGPFSFVLGRFTFLRIVGHFRGRLLLALAFLLHFVLALFLLLFLRFLSGMLIKGELR